MAKPKKEGTLATGRYVPCSGSFLPRPTHGVPVFLELTRCRTGTKLHVRCGLCGHRGFYEAGTVEAAFTREGARASVPKGHAVPVDNAGRPM